MVFTEVKVFKIFSMLSGLILLMYISFNWNDFTNKSKLTMDILGVCMFAFGGIGNLLSKEKADKTVGIIFIAAAIFTTFVAVSKFA